MVLLDLSALCFDSFLRLLLSLSMPGAKPKGMSITRMLDLAQVNKQALPGGDTGADWFQRYTLTT